MMYLDFGGDNMARRASHRSFTICATGDFAGSDTFCLHLGSVVCSVDNLNSANREVEDCESLQSGMGGGVYPGRLK